MAVPVIIGGEQNGVQTVEVFDQAAFRRDAFFIFHKQFRYFWLVQCQGNLSGCIQFQTSLLFRTDVVIRHEVAGVNFLKIMEQCHGDTFVSVYVFRCEQQHGQSQRKAVFGNGFRT